ncbi:Rpf2 [Symbiodinium sp. KB8]|nr:Rpf2 [Symbiodinium sp. KB8]
MGADALTQVLSKRKAKTHRGKKILREREPKVLEDAKTALVIRGTKTSNDMTNFLRELYLLRSPLSMLYMRKHEEHPFEDSHKLEQLCKKFDHSLFAFGSSSKKRPARLILGRLFDGHLLDMQEFGVEDYKSMSTFRGSGATDAMTGVKPLVVFQGAGFENDEHLKRAKSLLLDYFGGGRPDKVLLPGLESAIVFTVLDPPAGQPSNKAKVLFRRYRLLMQKSGGRLPRIEMKELGPSFQLTLDRTREPDKDRWKQAIKVPKAAKPKKVKNVKTTEMGKRIGKFHLGKQDFNQIHTIHHGASKKRKLTQALKQGAANAPKGDTPADAKAA